MAKKKKSRKYNPNKSVAIAKRIFIDNSLDDLAVAYIASHNDGKCQFYSRRHGEKRRNDQDIVNTMASSEFKWKAYLAVFCRDQINREYTQGVWIEFKERYYYGELGEASKIYHKKLIKECNKLHFITSGWLAIPSGSVISDKQANKILSDYGSHYHFAQWEDGKTQGLNNG